MGWEDRNGRRYFYSKRRTADGRVRSVYHGAGELGRAGAELARGRQAEREAERQALRRALAPVDALLRHTKRLEREARRLTAANLLASGWRQHKGQWRLRRRGTDTGPKTDMEPKTAEITPDGGLQIVLPADGGEEARALLERCDREDPDREDVRALRRWLRSSPEPYARALDMAEAAREAALTACAGRNVMVREMARAGLEEFQAALGYDAAGPLERVLIEQAGACWLVLQDVQRRYSNVTAEGYTFDEAEHFEKRLSAAQRRFLRSVEALERVRKLRRRGPVQVNVAAAGGTFQQVNG